MQVKQEKRNSAGFELKLVQRENLNFWKKVIISSAVVLVYLYIGIKNYLFFHSLIEILGIIIGFGVTIAIYYSSKIMKNGIYLYLGCLFLYTSFFQILHVFSYAGINILSSDSYNLSVQISVIAKFVDAIALFVMLIIPTNTIKQNFSLKRLIIPYTLVSALLITIYILIYFLSVFMKMLIQHLLKYCVNLYFCVCILYYCFFPIERGIILEKTYLSIFFLI